MDKQNREAHQCGKRNSNGITQPSGAATPRNSDAHKRIAVPQAQRVEKVFSPRVVQKYPVGPAGFRVLCPRKPGAFLETCSLYPPLAALHLFPLLGFPTHTLYPQGVCGIRKAAKYAVLTPGPTGSPDRAKQPEGSDSAPTRNAPCFAV